MTRHPAWLALLALPVPALAQDTSTEGTAAEDAAAEDAVSTPPEEQHVFDPAPFAFSTGGSFQSAPVFTTLGLDAGLRLKLHRRTSLTMQGSTEALTVWTNRGLAFDGETVVPLEAFRYGAGLAYRFRRDAGRSQPMFIDVAFLGGASVLSWERLLEGEDRARTTEGSTIVPSVSVQARIGIRDKAHRYDVLAPSITWTQDAGISLRISMSTDTLLGRRTRRPASRSDTQPLVVPVQNPFRRRDGEEPEDPTPDP